MQAILRKFWVKAQRHYKMDGAEKLLSISQCQTTVVYSVSELSGCRTVSHRCRIVRVPTCLGAEMSWCRIVPVPKCLAFVVWYPLHESECYFFLHLLHQNSCLVFVKKHSPLLSSWIVSLLTSLFTEWTSSNNHLEMFFSWGI